MRNTSAFAGAVLALVALAASASEVGLVTAVSGKVTWQEEKSAASELKPFVKVREGDRLTLAGPARLQIVYFEGGRQETWLGDGALDVGADASRTVKGRLQPEVKTLPSILVKQLAKTPSPDGNVKAGMVRLRSIPPPDRREASEKTYAEMRAQAEAGDRTPELYLLASYLEQREFDRLEALLGKMGEAAPGDAEVGALKALYARAVEEAKSGGK